MSVQVAGAPSQDKPDDSFVSGRRCQLGPEPRSAGHFDCHFDCHFDGTRSPSVLKRHTNVEGGAAERQSRRRPQVTAGPAGYSTIEKVGDDVAILFEQASSPQSMQQIQTFLGMLALNTSAGGILLEQADTTLCEAVLPSWAHAVGFAERCQQPVLSPLSSLLSAPFSAQPQPVRIQCPIQCPMHLFSSLGRGAVLI